ncbi:hypothetical protein VOLCADRAFT_95124 [Volvox carteri f. nagariensis]|uniref:UvrD-like helicase ATP-binding domain-containing protein n=1 Tax=Volvox carteri f. nagariensis TaxID=3068 RepID=D8U6N6_VOLCA|nr:uncharacterized protein VOLCADRAFT_95124 [Volvox carteri f. nagariensis]EFJ44747.1 hypothetical protein VOLCADRAFT_95124 [Volvox carteri f. nagariensis]|eukprot:XP_002954323.1 hypothetical protein VOLCADRAFT_95124 [Volvox carteri f. nagariensis]
MNCIKFHQEGLSMVQRLSAGGLPCAPFRRGQAICKAVLQGGYVGKSSLSKRVNSESTEQPLIRQPSSRTDKLNKDQLAAVLASEQTVRVQAGPGSGKTRVVAARAQHLINERGVEARRILAITFTNKQHMHACTSACEHQAVLVKPTDLQDEAANVRKGNVRLHMVFVLIVNKVEIR